MRLGVDFGTSHTVAVLAYPDGRTKSMLFDDGTPLLRSAVYADPDGTIQVGRDAVRRAGLDPTRYEPNPKQRIDEQTVLLGDGEHKVADLFAAVVGRVVNEVRRVAGSIPSDVVMTFPAAWGARRREILTDAARTAGLHTVRLIPEPVGAAVYFTTVLGHQVADGRPLGVFDFGGGTLDVAVVRRTGTTFTVLSTGGLPDLGGVDLDSALVDHLGELIAQRDPELWRRLSAPSSANDRRSRQLLWDDVRGAKESLSRTTSAPVNVPETDTDLHLTRDEFERLTTPLLQRAVDETRRVLKEARTEPTQLAGLFLVGGSSRVPLVSRMLHSGLGMPPTVLEQPEIAVAEGAAKLGAAKSGPGQGSGPASGQRQGPPAGPGANAPMSAPPVSGGPAPAHSPMSGPPAGHRSPAPPPPQRTNAPMSGAPASGGGYPVNRPVTPAPVPPRQYSPPPQQYSPPQRQYSPPPPRQQPVLPPVRQAPAPPPQPQVIKVPYAVPVQQPAYRPRKRSKSGWIIGLVVIVSLVCCVGAFGKPELFGSWWEGVVAGEPEIVGVAMPESLQGMVEPWYPVLDKCWTTDTGKDWNLPQAHGWTEVTETVDQEAAAVYCRTSWDYESDSNIDSILIIDTGGPEFVEEVAKAYDLKTEWESDGKAGLDEYDVPRAVVDGGYALSPDAAFAIVGGGEGTVSELTIAFTQYST